MTTQRAVLYLRQSTYREESISLEIQEVAGREYCRQRGYTVIAVESDPGISGRTWKRPAVLRTMGLIEAKTADVVVLWKWSRLSRSRLDWAVAVDKVESAGGRIESATEPLDTTTASGRFARGMLAEFAAFESERMGDVWKEAQQRRRRNGLPPNGGDRFGYIRDGSTYTPDPVTGGLLHGLYEQFNTGRGFTTLASTLNGDGHRTVTGAQWNRDKLRGILDSGFAAGLIIQGRAPAAKYYPGAHPALITADQWATYQHRRAQVSPPPRSVNPKYMLTGLAVCDDCGHPMRAISRNGARDGLGCGRYLDYRTGRFVTAKRTNAEEAVREWVFAIADDLDALATAEAKVKERRATAVTDAASIRRRIGKLDERISNIIVNWSGSMEFDAGLALALERLRKDRADLVTQEFAAGSDARAEFDVRTLAVAARDAWDRATPFELRRLLGALIREVRVVPPVERKIGGAGPVTFRVREAWD